MSGGVGGGEFDPDSLVADADMAVIRSHLDALEKLGFDSIQIFATKFESDGNTRTFSNGRGNWFARFGFVSLWIDREREKELESERREE